MKIQVLHIADCPNWESLAPVLAELIQELGLSNLTPTFTLIRTPEDAAKYRFAGSPTILIDGNDIVPGAEPTTDLACRVYHDWSRMVGSPTKASLREALLGGLGNANS